MKKSIQIILDINGDSEYFMKYPETCSLTLELSRSETWWGVFLSVIETFQAIKEDREYLLNAFNEWEISGYSSEFNLNITIAVLEFDEYKIIYTGAALPEYTDNTLYFKTKFTEVSNVQQFLDRSIERSFDMARVRETHTFDSLQGVFNVINAQNTTEEDININSLGVQAPPDELREVEISGTTTQTATQSFANGGNDLTYNYIGNKNTPKTKDYFFTDNSLSLPKRSIINVFLITNRVVPYAQDGSTYKAADTFKIEFAINNLQAESESINFTFYDETIGNAAGFGTSGIPQVDITNNTNQKNFLTLRTRTTGLSDYDNQVISYALYLTALTVRQTLTINYYTLNNSVDNLPITKILSDLFDVDIENSYLKQNFENYAFLPYDGAIAGTSTSTLTVNIADFLEEISKALSIGVTINTEDNRLLIKPIWEMFSDEELFVIEDDVISNFEISLNEFLKVNRLVLGSADRNFNYSYNRVGQNIQTNYNARNAFSGSLDLSLTRYKSQMYDFVDSYRDDVFDLYEEDKNDGEFTLFDKTRIIETSDYRFNGINSGHTAVSQIACWSWLLQTISPKGFDLQSESNSVRTYSPITGDSIQLDNNILPDNPVFNDLPQKITLRKINATIKITTQQYNRIVNNRDGYLTLIYKGVTYKGYINNLSLQIGKNMIATVELLERFEQ